MVITDYNQPLIIIKTSPRRFSSIDIICNLGDQLNRARLRKGLSIQKISQRVNKSRTTVHTFLTGQINKTVEIDTVLKIASGIGVNLQFENIEPA